ncbi:hypothetical protein [Actinoplanes sp. OR16]|uniref:hypothetical protein n=1 Tax=Actinoplanes sp. OR16 TaxID=946334 RepID=UPI001E4D5C91|nr:hypothetical protein [Actinoplanes sp. OR16]
MNVSAATPMASRPPQDRIVAARAGMRPRWAAKTASSAPAASSQARVCEPK